MTESSKGEAKNKVGGLMLACKLFLLFILGIVVIGTVLIGTLMTGAFSLDRYHEQLTGMLLPEYYAKRLTIGQSSLAWGGVGSPLIWQANDIQLIAPRDDIHAQLDSARVSIRLTHLLYGEVDPKSITASGLRVTMIDNRREEPPKNTGATADEPSALTHIIGDLSDSSAPSILLTDINIRYSNPSAGIVIKMEEGQLQLIGGQGTADLPLSVNNIPASIKGRASLAPEVDGIVDLEALLANIDLEKLCHALRNDCTNYPLPAGLLTASIAAEWSWHEGSLSPLSMNVVGENITLRKGDILADDIAVDTLNTNLIYGIRNKRLRITSAHLQMGKTLAQFTLDYAPTQDSAAIQISGSAKDMPVEHLARYWPPHLAPNSREWIANSITVGMAPLAEIEFTLSPEQYKMDKLPDDSLKAKVMVTGATLEYLPGFPKATNVDAEIDFTGKTITAKTTSGTLLKATRVKDGVFRFTNLDIPATPMEIEMHLASRADDVLTILSPPRFHFLDTIPINSVAVPTGSLDTTLILAFDAFSGESKGRDGIDWDRVQYDITATASNISGLSLEEAGEPIALSDITGSMKATNSALAMDMAGNVAGRAAEWQFRQEAGKGGEHQLKTTIPASFFARFGVELAPYLRGPLGIDANFSTSPLQVKAMIDLTDATIIADAANYIKNAAMPASLSIKGGNNTFPFRYKSNESLLSGTIKIGDDQTLRAIENGILKHGRSDLSFRYAKDGKQRSVTVTGKSLDIAEGEEAKLPKQPENKAVPPEQQSDFNFSALLGLNLDVDLERFYIQEDNHLKAVNGTIRCNPEFCPSAELQATLPDNGTLNFRIFNENNRRQMRLTSNNVGSLLRQLDITNAAYGGKLVAHGHYADNSENRPLDGEMLMTDFTLKEAPLLGRILNLTSLTGLVETLQGKGVVFDKLSSDMVIANDIIELKNLKMAGSSLGIIGNGAINLITEIIDMEGTLAPAYGINSFVGKIPLIGEALVGGEGEGLIAFSFSVRGPFDDPNVGANPLSVLTPGFTRNIFEIFDSPNKAMEKAPSQQEGGAVSEAKPAAPTPTIKPPAIQKPAEPPASIGGAFGSSKAIGTQ